MQISYDKIEKAKKKDLVDKRKLGRAGEYLVAGKLLMNGFNVYMDSVDDGIDLVVRKTKKFYFIQVKTAQNIEYDSGKFVANLNLDTFNKHPTNRSFIVFVLHYLGSISLDNYGDHNVYDETYIPIPAKELLTFLSKDKGHATIRIDLEIMQGTDTGNIAVMRFGKKKLILDEYIMNGFWQIEI